MANETCQICGGAIPDGEQMGGHTALCAGVVGERAGALQREVTRLREALATADSRAAQARAEAMAEALAAVAAFMPNGLYAVMQRIRALATEPPRASSPPVARPEVDWPAWWAALEPRDAWAALTAAPRRLAGPWRDSSGINGRTHARETLDGRLVAKQYGDEGTHVGETLYGDRAEADAALRGAGWTLVDAPAEGGSERKEDGHG